MANTKISALTSATSMANTEVFPIVQSGVTKKITKSAARGYLVYTALLNQTGTDAPVATVLGDNSIGAITWAYVSDGDYNGVLAGAFNANKVLVFVNLGQGRGYIDWEVVDANTIKIQCRGTDENPANDKFVNGSIEIRVYP